MRRDPRGRKRATRAVRASRLRQRAAGAANGARATMRGRSRTGRVQRISGIADPSAAHSRAFDRHRLRFVRRAWGCRKAAFTAGTPRWTHAAAADALDVATARGIHDLGIPPTSPRSRLASSRWGRRLRQYLNAALFFRWTRCADPPASNQTGLRGPSASRFPVLRCAAGPGRRRGGERGSQGTKARLAPPRGRRSSPHYSGSGSKCTS